MSDERKRVIDSPGGLSYEVGKGQLASIAKNFFTHMNEGKHRRNEERHEMLSWLERKVIRKILKIVNPFIQEQNGMYEVIHKVDRKIETVFSSQSRRKAFKKWKFYKRMKHQQSEPPYNKWNRELTMVTNGKRLKVGYWLDKEDVDDFFGKRSAYFSKRLLKLDEWVNCYLGFGK